MNDLGIRLTISLNHAANWIGSGLLLPIRFLPETVAAVVVAVVSGILMLIGFKYTSNQSAIKKIRSGIKSEFLALSLFKDNGTVNLVSQARILLGSLKSILYSLVPVAVMVVPVTLFLSQLALWWQVRPIGVGEETVVTVRLNGSDKSDWPRVEFRPSADMESIAGPIRIRNQRSLCWSIRANQPGYHRVVFDVDGHSIEKQLAVGQEPMRVSSVRPEWKWSVVILNPAEEPFDRTSVVRSIEVQYPTTRKWLTGTRTWFLFWLIGSMLTAFLLRGVFRVSL